MKTMDTARSIDLFENAPPLGLQRRLGLIKPDTLNVGRRALLVIAVGWLPIVVFTIVQSVVLWRDQITPLCWEVGGHARYLIAAPLLVLAEKGCVPWLGAIVSNFIEAGIVPDHARSRFEAAVDATRKLLKSTTAETVAVILAYLVVAAATYSQPVDQLPSWQMSGGVTPIYSLAGWWHFLVSLPLLLVLIFGWIWRLVLWARLLWLIARLELRLVASHPDRTAGLSFVGQSVRAFSVVALALATIVAGRSAHVVLVGGALPTPEFIFNAGFMVTLVVIFIAPLLVFAPTLMMVWRRATLEYNALADRVGSAFESKWLNNRGRTDRKDDLLESPDFSATADLYAVVANVHGLRLIPLDVKDLIPLAVAMLIPFIPVVLMTIPVDVIWSGVKGLLL
jgi:hypothetical protein